MAKNKQELEAELKAATEKIAELEKRLADNTPADVLELQRKLAAAEQQVADLAAGQATAELADGVEIRTVKPCGGKDVGEQLAVVLLAEGVPMNFLIDAVRSGLARVCDVPELGDDEE